MLRVGGKRIPPTEWERVIRSHPKVADCAVVAIQHKAKGQAAKAFVVKADTTLTEKDVLDLVAGKHIPYKIRNKSGGRTGGGVLRTRMCVYGSC